MTKTTKQKKAQKKKSRVSSYRKKLLEMNSISNIQSYYIASKIFPPVGNPHFWDIKEEIVFDEDITDPFGIGFDSKEDMTFLPEMP